MPRVKVSQFDVIGVLKELSDEADHALPQLEFQDNSVFANWFDAIKETFVKIRDSKTLEDLTSIEYPPCVVFEETENQNRNVDSDAPQTQRENIHAEVSTLASSKTSEKAPKGAAECQVHIQCDEIAAEHKNNSNESHTGTQFNTPVNVFKIVEDRRVPAVKCEEITTDCKSKSDESRAATEFNSSINVLKETTRCQLNVVKCDEIVADRENKSSESCKVNQSNSPIKLNNVVIKLERIDSSKLDVTYNLCTPESDKVESQNLNETPMLNQTFNKIINKTLILDSGLSQNSNSYSKKVNNDSGIITRSASKKNNTPAKDNNVRQGCKRKSSSSKDNSNKKPKNDITAAGPSSEKTQPKNPIRRIASKNTLTAKSKTKAQAVIVPSVQLKPTVVSKEQQILEEIKKKEQKANQNIKRVLAERQQKVEQNKKNREEKRTKTLQKRIQIEKEKEVRLEKHEAEVRTPQAKALKENAKNPVGKTRTKELIEQHLKENKLSGLSVSNHSDTVMNNSLKTPSNKKIEEDEDCYELTPLPNSSTYNFSDDEEEEEKPKGKHIPAWAHGVLLKHALIQQFYTPLDTDELFGRHIDAPNLAQIFKVNKKRYLKRTSSAIWNSPPLSASFKR